LFVCLFVCLHLCFFFSFLLQERKAALRHETISSQLTSIDVQVRSENAELQAKVEELEHTNVDLTHILSSRPTRRDHMDVLRRESSLMREIVRLRGINAALLKNNRSRTKFATTTEEILAAEGKMSGGVGGKSQKDDADDKGSNGSSSKESTMDRTSMRVDRTLRSKNILELSNAIASLDQYGFRTSNNNNTAAAAAASTSQSVELSKEAARVGWAATSLIVALMQRYNLNVARDIHQVIENMDRDASSLIGMQDCLQKIQNMVDQQANVKVGLEGGNYDEENDEEKDDDDDDAFVVDDDESALNLGAVPPAQQRDLSLEELESNIRVMLNQRRILAFEQSHPEKVLHDILLHFQMIVQAESLQDVVPRMQEMLTRMRLDRSALNSLRVVFGIPEVGQDANLVQVPNNELVNLIRAYATKQGLTPFNSNEGIQSRKRTEGSSSSTATTKTGSRFVPSRRRGSQRQRGAHYVGSDLGATSRRGSHYVGASLPRTFTSVLNEISRDGEGLQQRRQNN
jgi:hypothetical protein